MTMDDRVKMTPGWPASDNAMSNLLAQNWWAIALRGVFAIIFGVIALLMPGAALLAFVLLFAAYMLLDGILAIVAGVRAAQRHARWGWLIFEGILDLIAGGIAVVWPLITIIAFVFLMGAWAIVTGALLFGASFRLNIPHGRWLMALAGAVSVIWGFLLIRLAVDRGRGADLVDSCLRTVLRRCDVGARLSAAQPTSLPALGDVPSAGLRSIAARDDRSAQIRCCGRHAR